MQLTPIHGAAAVQEACTHMRSSSLASNLPLSKKEQPYKQPAPSQKLQQCEASPILRSSSHWSIQTLSEVQQPQELPSPIQGVAAV